MTDKKGFEQEQAVNVQSEASSHDDSKSPPKKTVERKEVKKAVKPAAKATAASKKAPAKSAAKAEPGAKSTPAKPKSQSAAKPPEGTEPQSPSAASSTAAKAPKVTKPAPAKSSKSAVKPASTKAAAGKATASRAAQSAGKEGEVASQQALAANPAKALQGSSLKELEGQNVKALSGAVHAALPGATAQALTADTKDALEGNNAKALPAGQEEAAPRKGSTRSSGRGQRGGAAASRRTGGRSAARSNDRAGEEAAPATETGFVLVGESTGPSQVSGVSGAENAPETSAHGEAEKSKSSRSRNSSRGRGRRSSQPAKSAAHDAGSSPVTHLDAFPSTPIELLSEADAKAILGIGEEDSGHVSYGAEASFMAEGQADMPYEDDVDTLNDFTDTMDSDDSDDVDGLGDEESDGATADSTGKGRQGAGKGKKEQPLPAKAVRRKMFVSVHPEEQVEVVLTEEGQVQEYFVEMLQQAKTKGNIYKAVIHNLDANLQAAFVSYGAQKNGFLQIDEVHPEYYNTPHDSAKGRRYPPIQKVLKQGQELLVQVVKEPTGTKGAFLTTYLSLPGRFLVLTPGREQIGVSRKVDNEEERARLRELLEGLKPGPGLGVIVRTVSMGTSKSTLQKDLQNLKRTWKDVRKRGTEESAPSLIYQEMSLTTRAVRDYLTDQVVEMWLDDEETAKSVEEMAKIHFPQKTKLVNLHKDANSTLFERFNLQRQLDQIHSREVQLPSGGRLVIDPTEALTAIDINSGRSSGKNNFEDMAYRTNIEAAKMIPLQLRLRDIGGQIVVDFIEMRDKSHWREVERTIRAGMKNDRARYDVGRVSSFGLLEMVRQRLGSSAISVSTEVCPHCKGTGVRRNMEWQTQAALRDIYRKMQAAKEQNQAELIYEVDAGVALHLLNTKRQRLLEMEQHTGLRLEIVPGSLIP